VTFAWYQLFADVQPDGPWMLHESDAQALPEIGIKSSFTMRIQSGKGISSFPYVITGSSV
jgi:hypothetical protein